MLWTSVQVDPAPQGAVPVLPCPGTPTEAYHFPPPDEKGPSVRLLEHPGGDLCPQASGAFQGPDVQVGADTLKESRRSMAWGYPGLTHPGLACLCCTPTYTEAWGAGGGRGWGWGSREKSLQEPGARPRGRSSRTAEDPSSLLSYFPVLCHSAFSPAPPQKGSDSRALTLKASCSTSTMLEESSCSTPSEETGKYEDSFCRRKCQAGAQPPTRVISLNPDNTSGVRSPGRWGS